MNETETLLLNLGKGNPGAITFAIELLKMAEDVDFKYAAYLFLLEELNIVGPDLYVLWNDICERNMDNVSIIMNSTIYGFLDKDVLKDACSRQDYSGKKLINFLELKEKLKDIKYI
jgi:hypothetical protein